MLAVADLSASGPRQPEQPLLQIVVETILRLPGLEREKSEDERAGEAEQRGAEGGSHAGKGPAETGFQVLEDGRHVAGPGRQAADHLADRYDGFDQAPEGDRKSTRLNSSN